MGCCTCVVMCLYGRGRETGGRCARHHAAWRVTYGVHPPAQPPHRPPISPLPTWCHPTQDDAQDARWFDVSSLPPLAFDHKLVVRTSLRHLAKQAAAQAVGESTRQHAGGNGRGNVLYWTGANAAKSAWGCVGEGRGTYG